MIVLSEKTKHLLEERGIESFQVIFATTDEEVKKSLAIEKDPVVVLTEEDADRYLQSLSRLKSERSFGVVLISDFPSTEKERMADEVIPSSFTKDLLMKSINMVISRRSREIEETKLLSEAIEYMELLSVYRRGMKIVGIVEQDVSHEILTAFVEECGAEGGVIWIKRGESFNPSEVKGDINLSEYQSYLGEELLRRGKPAVLLDGKILLCPLVMDEKIEGAVLLLNQKNGFSEREVKLSSILSRFSAIALRNWRKITEYMDKSLRTDFKMYTPVFFAEYMDKEIHKARRYRREFSLIYITVNNYISIRKNFSEPAVNETFERMLKLVAGSIRSADVFAKLSDSEFLLLLPETDYMGSWMTRLRIENLLQGRFHIIEGKKAFPVHVTLSSASYPVDAHTYGALLEVMKSRASFERSPLYQKISSFDKSDELFNFLLDEKEGDFLKEELGKSGASFSRFCISVAEFQRVLGLFADDLLKEGTRKAMLFLKFSHPDISRYMEEVKASLSGVHLRVFEMEDKGGTSFLLYMKGPSAYTMVGRLEEKGNLHEIRGVHSDSLLLTEWIMKRLVVEEKIDFSEQ